MLSEKQLIDFISLRVELIDLNIAAHFFIRKVNRFNFLYKKTTRHYILEELTALRYLENGIILHLTNLDDDSSNYSFREATKQINKTVKDQKVIQNLTRRLSDYRKGINSIKVNHRNSRIAHANSDYDLDFDKFLDFRTELKPLIIMANELGDLILGERLNTFFKLGSLEGSIYFRDIVETSTIDLDKQKGFT